MTTLRLMLHKQLSRTGHCDLRLSYLLKRIFFCTYFLYLFKMCQSITGVSINSREVFCCFKFAYILYVPLYAPKNWPIFDTQHWHVQILISSIEFRIWTRKLFSYLFNALAHIYPETIVPQHTYTRKMSKLISLLYY